MTAEEKRKRYEELKDELFEITFMHSVEEYSAERVREIVAEMEELFLSDDISDKYLSVFAELFMEEIEEDEELIQSSASECAIVEYDKFD